MKFGDIENNERLIVLSIFTDSKDLRFLFYLYINFKFEFIWNFLAFMPENGFEIMLDCNEFGFQSSFNPQEKHWVWDTQV